MKSGRTTLLVLIVSLAAWAATAAAATATGVYKGETKSSTGKICHYDVNGTDRTTSAPNYAMCPRTREFTVPAPSGSTDTAAPPAASNAGDVKTG